MDKEGWLTVQEVADMLRVKPLTIRRAIAKGKLTASRFGGRTGYRITPQAVQKYMEDLSKGAAAQGLPGKEIHRRPIPALV